MNRREALAVYLVGQFVAVAVLAAVVGRMLGRFPFGDPFTRPVATTVPSGSRCARWRRPASSSS